MILGVATDRTYRDAKLPDPLPTSWPFLLHTLSKLVENPQSDHLGNGIWRLVGHDPALLPTDASLRIVADKVYREDEDIRVASAEDYRTLPVQGSAGAMLAEWKVQDAVGVPRTPKAAPKAKGANHEPQYVSAALDEEQFWKLIEDAWAAAPALAKKRPGVARNASVTDAEAMSEALGRAVLPALTALLTSLSREQLIAFDRILEKKLYDLDRADIHAQTDGSDDGFLYARGYIVGIGRRYYEAVLDDPIRAFADMEEERICYLPDEIFEDRFGERVPPSGASRESGSNRAGWTK